MTKASRARNACKNRPERRVIMVPDRLPVALDVDDDDQWRTEPIAGGLVAALDPIMRRRGGVWIGWPGVTTSDEAGLRSALERQHDDSSGYRLAPVMLSQDQIDGFYEGFANEIIWPLFHNQFTACNFDPDYWRAYQAVNARFGECVGQQVEPDDFIWVHDYHLMTVAQHLRARGIGNRCGFFLHTPFPSLDIFANLPWSRALLQALLAYDFVGFQTATDRDHFVECVAHSFEQADTTPAGDKTWLDVVDPAFDCGRRRMAVAALPISVDYASVVETATSAGTEAVLERRCQCWGAKTIALGVDRLDQSKGLPQKLKAFGYTLERYPELRGQISLDQYVVPARDQVPQYAEQKAEIDRLVGEINGRFTYRGWIPIHNFYQRLAAEELMAYYRAADIALVTPLKEGMNLVAKEYCAAKVAEQGVLILSQFTGTRAELGEHAILVNPHDVEGMAEAIHAAHNMASDARRQRMRALRAVVGENDAPAWVRGFLQAAGADEPA